MIPAARVHAPKGRTPAYYTRTTVDRHTTPPEHTDSSSLRCPSPRRWAWAAAHARHSAPAPRLQVRSPARTQPLHSPLPSPEAASPPPPPAPRCSAVCASGDRFSHSVQSACMSFGGKCRALRCRSTQVGTVGAILPRSMSGGSSLRDLEPLRALHSEHAVTTFSHEVGPCAMGRIWGFGFGLGFGLGMDTARRARPHVVSVIISAHQSRSPA